MLNLDRDDRADLHDLINRYALLVDLADYVGVTELFTPDGCLVAPAPPENLCPVRRILGRDDLEEELRRLEYFGMTFHALAGHVLEATGAERARGRVNCVAHHVLTAGKNTEDLVWHLRYDDVYVRTPERWLIEQRAITIELVETRPVRRANDRATVARSGGPIW